MTNPPISYFALPKGRLYVVFLAVCATLAAFMAPGLWRLSRISQAPAAAIGVVAGLDCRNHGHVNYTFGLGGATIAGATHYVEGVNCRGLRLGDRLNIAYEKGVPENNYAFAADNQDEARVAKAFHEGVASLAAFVGLGPLFLVLVAKFFLRVSTWLNPMARPL